MVKAASNNYGNTAMKLIILKQPLAIIYLRLADSQHPTIAVIEVCI